MHLLARGGDLEVWGQGPWSTAFASLHEVGLNTTLGPWPGDIDAFNALVSVGMNLQLRAVRCCCCLDPRYTPS